MCYCLLHGNNGGDRDLHMERGQRRAAVPSVTDDIAYNIYNKRTVDITGKYVTIILTNSHLNYVLKAFCNAEIMVYSLD